MYHLTTIPPSSSYPAHQAPPPKEATTHLTPLIDSIHSIAKPSLKAQSLNAPQTLISAILPRSWVHPAKLYQELWMQGAKHWHDSEFAPRAASDRE